MPAGPNLVFHASETFDMRGIMKPNAAGEEFAFGITSSADQIIMAVGTVYVIIYKHAASANWFIVSSQGALNFDTGIPFVNQAYVEFRIRRINATDYGFTIDANAEIIKTIALSNSNVVPVFAVVSATGTNALLYIDYFGIKFAGLTGRM